MLTPRFLCSVLTSCSFDQLSEVPPSEEGHILPLSASYSEQRGCAGGVLNITVSNGSG